MIVGNGEDVMAVAHNGNIVNADTFPGTHRFRYVFNSSTDSEVIANLIHSAPGQNWLDKIRYAMRRIRGLTPW